MKTNSSFPVTIAAYVGLHASRRKQLQTTTKYNKNVPVETTTVYQIRCTLNYP
jgi:hypothetical protein